jgi:hypothetical protein
MGMNASLHHKVPFRAMYKAKPMRQGLEAIAAKTSRCCDVKRRSGPRAEIHPRAGCAAREFADEVASRVIEKNAINQ